MNVKQEYKLLRTVYQRPIMDFAHSEDSDYPALHYLSEKGYLYESQPSSKHSIQDLRKYSICRAGLEKLKEDHRNIDGGYHHQIILTSLRFFSGLLFLAIIIIAILTWTINVPNLMNTFLIICILSVIILVNLMIENYLES